MKTKLLLSALLSFYFCLLSSQVPQGFNYQAIARDGSGNPIANATIKVMLSILSDTTGFYLSGSGTYIWEEEQTNVKTNAFSLFTVVLGNPLASKVQGTASSFSAIDWVKTPLYIGTKIANPTTYKILGSAKLWSVPYSMVSSGLSGPLKKLGVTGVATSPDSALFEVKNRNGQTVFAVYNEGVRVYVDDGVGKGYTKGGFAIGGFGTVKSPSQEFFRVTRDSTRIYLNNALGKSTKGGFAIGGFDVVKGVNQNLLTVSDDSVRVYIDTNPVKSATKGGFAIGGFDQVKTQSQEYLRVTRDSTRVYINNQPTKGATKGGFAIGGFDQVKGGNANFFNVETSSTEIINPSQNRILWYPAKNAFLAGKVLIEKPDSVGINSFSSGFESKSKGVYSQALGYKAIARGDYSTAIGNNAVAEKVNSFAFGDSARATNSESYAIGRGAIASGYRSFALGSSGVDEEGLKTDLTHAKGDYSFAIGQGSQALGLGSFAIGIADTAIGDFAYAIGYKTISNSGEGWGATSMGYNTKALAPFASAFGLKTTASGLFSTSMGEGNIASGWGATAFGGADTSSAQWSTVMGSRNKANGPNSTAMGELTIASGSHASSMGYMTKANSSYSLVIGFSNDTTCSGTGRYAWTSTDPIFIIGNGTYTSRSNAFTVLKNGNTGIGNISPTQMLDVNGNARFRSIGSDTYYAGLAITNNGTLTTSTSDISMKKDIVTINQALQKVLEMNGVYFSWKNDNLNNRRVGFIAQEMEKVLPEVVFTNPVDGLKGINYPEITAVLAQAVKEQQQQIESTKQENQKLRSELDELKSLVNTLIANQKSQSNN